MTSRPLELIVRLIDRAAREFTQTSLIDFINQLEGNTAVERRLSCSFESVGRGDGTTA